MKAVVVHQYGGPGVLKFEEYPDPVAGPGEVLASDLRSREAEDDQGCGVASATFASGGSTITWTGRESSSQLGIAAALAGVDRFFMNGSGTRDAVFVMSTVSSRSRDHDYSQPPPRIRTGGFPASGSCLR